MEYNDVNLLALYNEGLAYSAISNQLNVSKSVISGRLRRIRAKDSTLAPARAKPVTKPEPAKPIVVRRPPNRNTFLLRGRGVPMSKAEMYAMLKAAVKNT